ncbi:DUF6468 domain-containing protein [Alsobacter sp. KACC 23698]|uniref:DUF6468 domain-containing protein n=1 Tax=Alsobacter sp. KACC 23698 TaxID=3149229 RepID=A0AAU7JA88_9HYPH
MIGVLIELLVCVLLATTIGYCIVLDRRLRRLKADEATMRRTIIDLMTATENADRAVAGLRAVVEDCDKTIGAQLRVAEQHSAELAGRIQSGDDVISRISRIVETARGGLEPAGPAAAPRTAPSVAPPPPPAVSPREAPEVASNGANSRLAATLAAAEAFAQRARRRLDSQAA